MCLAPFRSISILVAFLIPLYDNPSFHTLYKRRVRAKSKHVVAYNHTHISTGEARMSSLDYRKNPAVRYSFLWILLLPLLALLFSPPPAHADGGFPIIGVLHAGQRPEGIAVDTETHIVYIAYEFPSLVVGFDPISGKVRWSVTVGDSANDVQVDSTNHHVYVASGANNNTRGFLTILDGASGKILFNAITIYGNDGLAIDTIRQLVYLSSSDHDIISVYSLTTSAGGKISAVSSTLTVGTHPQPLGVNSRLGRLYVGDVASNTIDVIDEESGHTLATIPVAALPVQPLRVDEATGRVYVVCSTGQELDVIDGHINKVIARIPVSPFPEGVAFNTATGRIYVADEGHPYNVFSGSRPGRRRDRSLVAPYLRIRRRQQRRCRDQRFAGYPSASRVGHAPGSRCPPGHPAAATGGRHHGDTDGRNHRRRYTGRPVTAFACAGKPSKSARRRVVSLRAAYPSRVR